MSPATKGNRKEHTCYIVHDYRHARVSDVAWNQAPEPLLACRVPELETYGAVVEVHCLYGLGVSASHFLHLRPDTRKGLTFDKKSMPIVAWYVLSKVSYIKRVMREVLPTVQRKSATLAEKNKTSHGDIAYRFARRGRPICFVLLARRDADAAFGGSLLEFFQRIRVCGLSHCGESWEIILD